MRREDTLLFVHWVPFMAIASFTGKQSLIVDKLRSLFYILFPTCEWSVEEQTNEKNMSLFVEVVKVCFLTGKVPFHTV